MARTITGTVKSDKVDKTIVVLVQSHKTHPVYKKQYVTSRTFMAHDEKNEAKVGDKVVIIETRPISRQKRFALQEIVEKAVIRHVEETPGGDAHKRDVTKEKDVEEKHS
jgi:small subunit ribosomal protein S17